MGMVYLGVELLFHCVVWSFDVFCFCLFSSVLNSNVDPEIVFFFVHLGHGVVVFVCVSLFGFVSMNALLILSQKKKTALINFTLILTLLLFFFFVPCSFLYWAINVVDQPFAWHSQICANSVRALCGRSACYTIYLSHYTLHKGVQLK